MHLYMHCVRALASINQLPIGFPFFTAITGALGAINEKIHGDIKNKFNRNTQLRPGLSRAKRFHYSSV